MAFIKAQRAAWAAALAVCAALGTSGAASGATPRADSIQCNTPTITEDGHRFTIRCYRGPGRGFYASASVCGPGHCTRQGTNIAAYGEYATAWSTGFFTSPTHYQAFSV
ncbi:hypothetical protein [Streptomyces sp. KL118A]|uniref:hypothetical protein n=1 Tax=Streptomyces sp. KL118A TaxID=3045153 RepID=UPI00278C4909|nr:hypothetical protein [Streptomyces sp. KL118A]